MNAQPAPVTTSNSREVLPLLIRRLSRSDRELLEADLRQRAAQGLVTYGVPLMTHNGRDTLRDLLDELLDAMKYMTQHEEESGDNMLADFVALRRISLRVKSKMVSR